MKKVKLVCETLKITQTQLANLMGLHYTAFSKWNEKIPKNMDLFLDSILENHKLKQELESIKKAIKILKDL